MASPTVEGLLAVIRTSLGAFNMLRSEWRLTPAPLRRRVPRPAPA